MEKIKITSKELELLVKRAKCPYPCNEWCDMWMETYCSGDDITCDRYKKHCDIVNECQDYEKHLLEIEGDSHVRDLIKSLKDIDANNRTIAILERCNLKQQSIVDNVLDRYVEIDDGSFNILDGTKEEKK